ncbi:hypothetical protein D9M71_808500 [compost metagenome]
MGSEIQAGTLEHRGDMTAGTTLRWLDQDNLGTQISQQTPGHISLAVGQFDNTHARQGQRRVGGSCVDHASLLVRSVVIVGDCF